MYRLYLKDAFGTIIGRADFDAEEKAQPLAIAATIFQDCSDMAAMYELWQRDVLIVSSRKPTAPDQAAALSDHQRQLVMATETALHDSDWMIRESTKLIEKIGKPTGLSAPGSSGADDHPTATLATPMRQRNPAMAADPANSFAGFIAAIESPALRAIAKHWNEVRGTKLMPSWDDLSSSALAPHFKLLWGYQFDRQRGEFTGKLAGTHVRQLDPNFCGAKLADIHPPQVLDEAQAFLAKVATTPGLGLCGGRLFTIGGHTVTGERLALPLAANGISADGILGVSDYVCPAISGPVALIHENIEWCAISRVSA